MPLSQPSQRILIIGADGLRPDLLDPILMPTVAQLASQGVRFRDHHSVFPTHTRVVMSTLTSGVTPGQHGIVANTMLVPFATDDHIIDTSNYRHIDALDRFSGGQALLAPTLGEILGTHDARLAVAGTGSGGSSVLWTRKDRSRIVNTNTTYGIADLYDLREKLGELPPINPRDPSAQLNYAARAVSNIFLPDTRNHVIVLWMSEPDGAQHYFGLGSPEAAQALRAVDAAVAHVLSELDKRGLREQFDLFFMSDHGHSTVAAHQSLGAYLPQAAKDLGHPLPPLATASDYIYAEPGTAEPTADALKPLIEWLLAQPWTGVVLGGRPDIAALPGVIALDRVWNDHSNARRPLLAVSPKWSHTPNEFGVRGTVQALTTQGALKASHGSASPYDTHAVLIAHGPRFQAGVESHLPTGVVDVLPTILHLLGLPQPTHLDGRVLVEGLRQPTTEPPSTHDELIEPTKPSNEQSEARLLLHRVGRTTYLHGSLQTGAIYP